MKRIVALVLILGLFLSGCSLVSTENHQPVLFYYQTAQFRLGEANGTIRAEERDGTGHITDMDYLLRLYLTGPLSEDLLSPFPSAPARIK